jgi:hypothetical protein
LGRGIELKALKEFAAERGVLLVAMTVEKRVFCIIRYDSDLGGWVCDTGKYIIGPFSDEASARAYGELQGYLILWEN